VQQITSRHSCVKASKSGSLQLENKLSYTLSLVRYLSSKKVELLKIFDASEEQETK
jgi:hypothetical protein